jgi:hypothetical protein
MQAAKALLKEVERESLTGRRAICRRDARF